MGAKVCGKCKRGFPKYLDSCPVCHPSAAGWVPAATHTVALPLPEVTSILDGELVPGQPCPTCAKPYGKSQAQRSREWRERQKVTILDDKPVSPEEEQRRRKELLAWDITQRELREAQ